jgi:hypothetical protein
MAGWQDMNGSVGEAVIFGIAHNISSLEEKVAILKSERSMTEDLSLLSIRSVSSAVGRTMLPNRTQLRNRPLILLCTHSRSASGGRQWPSNVPLTELNETATAEKLRHEVQYPEHFIEITASPVLSAFSSIILMRNHV